MNYTENITGTRISVKAAGTTIGDDVKVTVRGCIKRLNHVYNKIHWADIFFEDKREKRTQQKQVSIRLGIPRNEPFASKYGDNFHALLASVEDKLKSQLEKR